MGTRMPGEGFEPPTFGLQNRCTTTVLTRLKAREEIKINRTPPVAASLGTISDFPEMYPDVLNFADLLSQECPRDRFELRSTLRMGSVR